MRQELLQMVAGMETKADRLMKQGGTYADMRVADELRSVAQNVRKLVADSDVLV